MVGGDTSIWRIDRWPVNRSVRLKEHYGHYHLERCGLNTSTTFAGSISNYGAANISALTKVGTGTLI